MTPKQISLIRALLHKAGLADQKEDIIWSFTDERTVHVSELTYAECNALVKYLNAYLGQENDPAEKMRRKILSMAHEMHWEHPDGRINMTRVNNWCLRYGGKSKPLNDFNNQELPTLVTQFENAYRGFLKGI